MLATLTRWWSRFDRWIEFIMFIKGAVGFVLKGAGWLGFVPLAMAATPPSSLPVQDPHCLERAVEGVLGLCESVETRDPVWVSGEPDAGPGSPGEVAPPEAHEELWEAPVVITSYYDWPHGWDGSVDEQGQEPPPWLAELRNHLGRSGMQAQIRRATDVVALGVASCEGDGKEEVRRAGNRARTLARLIDEVQPGRQGDPLQIWGLNLGQWREECPDGVVDTRRQRRVLIVGLTRHGDPSSRSRLDDAKLLAALENLRALPVKPSDYAGSPNEPLVPYK